MLLRTCLVLIVLGVFAKFVEAMAPRSLPEGQLPNDSRLQQPKDLNGYFPFTPPDSVEEWNTRASDSASADARFIGLVANAHQDASQLGDSWSNRSARLHRRESLL